MSKEIAITKEKQIIASIKKDAGNFTDCANKAIHYAISAGEKLIELKKITKHGQWENRLKNDFHDVFGVRQLQRFIEIAESKYLAIGLNSDKTLTLEQTIKAISDATPEQIEIAKQLQEDEELRRINAEAEKQAKTEAKKQPEIIEGEFTEVKAPETASEKQEKINIETPPEEDPFEVLQETIDMLSKDNAALVEEIDSVAKIFESNDQLVTAHAEVKKLQELNRVLKESLNGSMNSENAAKRQAKMWKAKYERLAKETGRD